MSRFIPKTGLVLSLVGGFAALTILACLLRKLIGPLVTARFDAPSFNTRPYIRSPV